MSNYLSSIGVVGSGKMGAGIAQVITYADLPVVLYDISEEQTQKGLEEIQQIYQSRVDKGKMDASTAAEKVSYVTITTDLNDLADVDLIIEAVPESVKIKSEVFSKLNEICNEDTIFATNTSAISITELGAASGRPDRFVGLHFFYPANIMKLVEIIPGLDTDDDTVSSMESFAMDIRKIPAVVKECPGFLVNRLLLPYLNYCAEIAVHAGLRPVEDAALEFGFPMGPFTLMDNLGLDVCCHAALVMEQGYGLRAKVSPVIKTLVNAGRFGVRTGAGFFEYDEREDTFESLVQSRYSPALNPTAFAKREFDVAIALMVNEAALCLQENITDSSTLDTAMLAGIGFPLDKDGLLHYADEVGLDVVLDRLVENAEKDPMQWPSQLVRQMVSAGHLGKKTGEGFFSY
jgi:3-hydroxyacyl-CoA dehydrogenase / enoyl-CoA hydratase / 3-hydroxybutyryl-CoA epimerase